MNVLAKIDTIDAIHQYDEIIEEADGVVFVRNELQWELQAEKLVLAQKWATEQANAAAKPIIIQSQVLESMIGGIKPTR